MAPMPIIQYDPADSYGMTDIYKLEVFTDLHPRKFILNGITRVEGQVNPDYSQYIATLVNIKTGKIIDQSRLNSDGTYTLNALSGDYHLQIKGKGINDNDEKISMPIPLCSLQQHSQRLLVRLRGSLRQYLLLVPSY
jgi:hypothetical protein